MRDLSTRCARTARPPQSPATVDALEHLEAAVEVSRRGVAELPSLSAIVVANGRPAAGPIRAQILTANRWLSFTAAELEGAAASMAQLPTHARACELLEEAKKLHVVVLDRLQRMEQLWDAPAGSLPSVPLLQRSEFGQLHGDMSRNRLEFWKRLFAIPCVARQRVLELKRCIAGEVSVGSEIFSVPTDTRSDARIKSEIQAACSFFDRRLSAGASAVRDWATLGGMLAALPPLPESALERSHIAIEKGEELRSLSASCALGPDEARRYGVQRNRALLQDDLGGDEPSSRARIADLVGARADYLALRDYMYLANVGLAIDVARQYREDIHNCDDLHQASRLGLLKAIERFDPGKNCAFSTFAGFWLRLLCTEERGVARAIIKVPGHARTFFHALLRMPTEQLHSLDESRAAKEYSLRPRVVSAVQRVAIGVKRFSGDADDSGRGGLAEIVADTGGSEAARLAEQLEAQESSEALMRQLGQRERKLLALRFGIGGGKAHTLKELASLYGTSSEHIGVVINQLLEKLRRSQD